MTTNQSPSRSEEVRRRRSQPVQPKPAPQVKKNYHPGAFVQPARNKPASTRSVQGRSVAYNPRRKHLDIAFNTSRTRVQTPGITLPTLGPRLASGLLLLAMLALISIMWNSSLFKVAGVKLIGSQRITETEINALLPIIGKSILQAVPEKIEQDLLANFPAIQSLKVSIALPNQVVIQLTERIPAILWQSTDGSTSWIDANGVKFPAGEQIDTLVTVNALGDPPVVMVSTDDGQPPHPSGVFLEPALINSITGLLAIAPPATTLTYNPVYGLGWSDPRGWLVYMGENVQDLSEKMTIYQAIVEKLTQQGIHPVMISLEYLDAPFYRTE